MTPEQKAAKAAERKTAREKNAATIQSGTGNAPVLAIIENTKMGLDEQIESLGEGQEGLSNELKGLRADLEKTTGMVKNRKSGSRTDGMETDKFSFAKIGRVFATGRNFATEDTTKGVGYELEALVEAARDYGKNMEKKDIISSLTGGSGGFPLPIQIKEEIIAAARSESALFGMGVWNESLDGMSSFSVPIETTSAGGTGDGVIMKGDSVQEGGAITVTRNGYKLANFTPRKYALAIGITNDLLRQGGQFVETFVRNQAALDVKNELERLVIAGRGQAHSEPTGILNRSDLTAFDGASIDTNGRLAQFKDFKDFQFSLMGANRYTKDSKFLTHPLVMRGPANQYATLAAGGDPYPTFPSVQMASVDKLPELLGYDVRTTTNVGFTPKGTAAKASAIMYGQWRNVWVPFWGPMEFLMTNLATVAGVSAFENDMSWMRFVQMYDVNIVAPDSMIAAKGFLTTVS